MKKLLLAPLAFALFSSVAFGQAFSGPASIAQPTTANHCLKVQTTGGSTIIDSGMNCGSGSGTVTSVTAGTGLTGGTITASGTIALALPQAATIGGVFSKAAITHNFLTSISSVDGSVGQAQPACADISDAGSGCSGAASAVGANPSQTITGAVHNGSASTFMRSDAAPALGTITQQTVINLNAATAPTPITGTVLQIVGADAAAGFIETDMFAGAAIFTGRRADGTGASPTAVQSGDVLAGFSARPYDGTAYATNSVANVQGVATENFTAAHHGADVAANCTQIATLTTGECGRFKYNGFTIPTGSTYQINGTQIATGALSDSANIALLNAANTFTNKTTVSGASFGLSGNISAPTWTTAGIRYANVAATLTDTTAATGTTAVGYTDVFGGNTIAATNTGVIFTKYATLHIAAPTAGTNVTFTNSYAADLDSLTVGTSNPFTVSAAGMVVASTNGISAEFGDGSNTSVQIYFSYPRATVGYDGANVFLQGTTSKGVRLLPNGGSTNGLYLDSSSNVQINGNGFLSSNAAANLQLGAVDAAAPVAQTLQVQSVVTATSNTAGALWKFRDSAGTGSAASGGYEWDTHPLGGSGSTPNAAVSEMTLSSAGVLNVVGGYSANGSAGVSCAANTVTLLTQTVTNGLVTHC